MTVISKRGARALALTAVGTMAFGLMVGGSQAAYADAAPTGTDVVGVGSDTLQYMLDFGADGDGVNSGNNVGKKDRLISFDATPDANARAGYLPNSVSNMNPTIVLRGGTSPVQRPNGSGAGISALSLDVNHLIDFARSSSALNASQVNAAKTTNGGVGDLHEVRLATDTLTLAAANNTNAPALSAAQLKDIYTCSKTNWTQVGGSTSGTIIPVVPQLGSGTRSTFLTGIGFTVNSDNSTTPALGACVKTAEENDPYALYITDAGAPSTTVNPNAIEPMSGGRLNMYENGYFDDPNVKYPNPPQQLIPAVKLINSGTPSDSTPLYSVTRGLYVIFRESDVTSTTGYNGSTKNWVNTFFYSTSGTPFFKGAVGQALLASAGVTPAYANCGVNPTSASACS